MEKEYLQANKFSVIGNFTQDHIITHTGETIRNGGSAYFISKALLDLGNVVCVFTNSDVDVDIYKHPRLTRYGHNSPVIAVSIDEEHARASINHSGRKIAIDEIPSKLLNTDCTVVATTFSELDNDALRHIRETQPNLLAVDIQGFARSLDPITHSVVKEAIEIDVFTGYDVIKMNKKEIDIQFKGASLDDAASELQKLAIGVCLFTLGSDGAIIYADDKYTIPAQKKDVQYTVGAGDNFFASFLDKYLAQDSIENAGISASDYASKYLSMECI